MANHVFGDNTENLARFNVITLQIYGTLGTETLLAWSLQCGRKDGATQRDGERERCVMTVKDKALQYNANIGFPPSQSAHCTTLCEVFVLED